MTKRKLFNFYAKDLLKVCFIKALSNIFLNLGNVFLAIELGNITNHIIYYKKMDYNYTFFVSLLFIVVIISPIFQYISNKILLKLSLQQDVALLQKVLNQDPSYINLKNPAEFSNDLIDNGIEYRWAIIDLLVYSIEIIFIVVIFICLIYKYGFRLTLLLFSLIIGNYIFTYFVSIKKSEYKNNKIKADNYINKYFYEMINNYSFLKINKFYISELIELKNKIKVNIVTTFKKNNIDNIYVFLELLSYNISYVLIIFFCLKSEGAFIEGNIISITIIYALLKSELTNLKKIQQALKMIDIVGMQMIEYLTKPVYLNKVGFKSLELKELVFHYPDGNLIEFPNVRINAGDKVAIVGSNGSGKSTLLNIIAGFIDVDVNCVLVNNQAYDKSIIRSFTSYIDVESLMFNELVEEYFYANTSKNNKQKNIFSNQFLKKNTSNLSGGERKKLDFERVFYENKDLILVDEPEVFLDKKSKKELFDKLNVNKNTFIFATHDSSLINKANIIILLK